MFRFILPPNKRTTDDAFVALLCFCHVALAHARHAVTLHKIQIQELGAHYSRVGVVKLSNGLFEITKIGRGGGDGCLEGNVRNKCQNDMLSRSMFVHSNAFYTIFGSRWGNDQLVARSNSVLSASRQIITSACYPFHFCPYPQLHTN